jgi:hypothetical protein
MDWLLSPWTIAGVFGSLTALAVAGWWFAPAVAAFFVNTKLGRYIAAGAGVIFAIWFAAMKIYQAGKRAVKDQIKRDSIQKDERREVRDAELKGLDDDALRKRSDRWLSDK